MMKNSDVAAAQAVNTDKGNIQDTSNLPGLFINRGYFRTSIAEALKPDNRMQNKTGIEFLRELKSFSRVNSLRLLYYGSDQKKSFTQ
jgi:hypothetical protein